MIKLLVFILMKNLYILSLLVFSGFINQENPFLTQQNPQEAQKTLEATNPFLDINKTWEETIKNYATYTPFYIAPELSVKPFNIKLLNKELRAIINLFGRQNPTLQEAVQNEYLSNSWILILLSEGKDPRYFPNTIKLLEQSITDLNNTLIPILEKYNRPQPYTLFNSFPLEVEYQIPSYPSIQTAQNKLALILLEDLSDETSPTTYLDLNRRALIYGLSFPQDIKEGSSVADEFYLHLRKSTLFQEDMKQAKAEWK